MRWRHAIENLSAAGLVLDAEETSKAAPSAPTAAEEPPKPDGTPYATYLRVLASKDSRIAWETFGPRVLEGVAEERRDALGALFARRRECGAERPPPMEGVRDLVFANRLAGALEKDASASVASGGRFPLREWLSRYETMVALVERTRTAWSLLPSVLRERGEPPGLSAAGTPLYRRVTDLALAHLRASLALQEAYPVRYRPFSSIALAMSPGALGDDKIKSALVKLTEVSVKANVRAAKSAEGLLGSLAAGGAAGISYPPALREPLFAALADATTARLRGDFRQKTGWTVALLYAIDAAYRVATDQTPNPWASVNEIARALLAPDVAHPALASLATAAARYVALGLAKKLDPEKVSPERRKARADLRAALAGLGAPGEAPGAVLDDVTTLADGLIAVLSTAIGAGLASKPAAKASACVPKASLVQLDPALRRALGTLGDVRRRIGVHPKYKAGDGAWMRRVRLLVTVLSDAMDLVLEGDAPMRAGSHHKPVFSIPTEEARKVAEDALRDLDDKAITELVGGAYGVFREVAAAGDPAKLLESTSGDVRHVASGLYALFRGEALGGRGPSLGVAFLDAVAGMRREVPSKDDLIQTLARYAAGFYERHEPDQGDLCLLGAQVLASVTKTGLPASAVDLATNANSRIAWVLAFSEEMRKSGAEHAANPAVYAAGMRKATDDACQVPDAEATLAVMQAIQAFHEGHRKEARDALDRVLENADEKGFAVPHMVYRYDEKTATKVFQVMVDVSYANGVLNAGNTLQLGFGFRSGGEPGGALTSTLAPLDSSKAGEDAARYYVATAALATVYHLLDGDADRAIATGRRAVVALSAGLKLGPRTLHAERPASWGSDARETLVVAAQLAADAGQPFLAGDLWTVVRQGLPDGMTDKDIAAVLDGLPLGLAGLKELHPVVLRARRSLKVLAAPLPCADHKVDVGGFEDVACADYPIALSLRIADVLKKLPRLRRGTESSPHCGVYKSLDAFLAGGDKGAYDPDAFTRAVEDLRADGKIYDAAILLARQKHPSQCTPTVVATARALGRSPALGPWIRSDLLSSAVNCTAAAGGADVEADLLQIDADTRKLPDPSRNVRLVLSVADLALRSDRWAMLAKLVEQPDFIAHWMGLHPNAATAALLLDHAVAAIEGRPVALDRTKASRDLLCETFRSSERAELCALVDALRAPLAGPMAERQRVAKDAVRKLVTSTGGPAAKRP
jgi:hypothetical protein